jgi:hypothetical protein
MYCTFCWFAYLFNDDCANFLVSLLSGIMMIMSDDFGMVCEEADMAYFKVFFPH